MRLDWPFMLLGSKEDGNSHSALACYLQVPGGHLRQNGDRQIWSNWCTVCCGSCRISVQVQPLAILWRYTQCTESAFTGVMNCASFVSPQRYARIMWGVLLKPRPRMLISPHSLSLPEGCQALNRLRQVPSEFVCVTRCCARLGDDSLTQ